MSSFYFCSKPFNYQCDSKFIHLCHRPLSTVVIHVRLPPELQKRLVSLLSSPVEQLQVLSSAVLRETLPLSGQELNYNQENISQLNSHAAALLLSQVGSDAYVVFGFIPIYFVWCVGFLVAVCCAAASISQLINGLIERKVIAIFTMVPA